MIGRPKNTPAKFWRNVDVRGPDDCWPWKLSLRKGYGAYTVNRKSVLAHRCAWEIANNQAAPPDSVVMHGCNNKICCNPAHLSLGDHGKNSRDAHRDGLCRIGEAHHMTKLSAAEIERIRADTRSQTEIAAAFGVSQAHISRIKLVQSRKYG